MVFRSRVQSPFHFTNTRFHVAVSADSFWIFNSRDITVVKSVIDSIKLT